MRHHNARRRRGLLACAREIRLDGPTLAITGANSAVGTALLRHIAGREELRAVAAVRRREALAGLPYSPRIARRLLDYGRPARVRDVVAGADCLVHLAGVLIESGRTSYQSGNVDTTRVLVEAALNAGVGRIVFVSSLGANARSPNGYYRSKREAENLVAAAGVTAAIIRTPLLLGPDTAGGRALLRDAARRSVRVLGGGAHVLRPLDVDDLCRAILHCCADPAGGVRTYELVGPTALSQRDLLLRTAGLLGNDLAVRTLPIGLAKLGALCAGLVRSGGLTPAVIDVITASEMVRHNGDKDLGIELTPLADTLARLVEASRTT